MKHVVAIIFGVIALVVGGIFFTQPAYAQTIVIGASPGSHSINNAVRDISVYRDIVISRSGNMNEATLSVGFSGDAGQFFRGSNELIIPAGQSIVTYTLEVRPEAAPDGFYTGYVDFAVSRVEGEATDENAAVIVRPGVAVRIDLTVQDEEIFDVNIGDLLVTDTEERRPLFVSFMVNNSGNVMWKPEKIEFVIDDLKKKGEKTILTIGEAETPLLRPGIQTRVRYGLNHELEQGSYTVTAKIYYRGALFHRSKAEPLTVYEEGHFLRKGDFAEFKTNKAQYLRGEPVKLVATYKNIGELPSDARLVAEVYSGEQLINTLSSESTVVDPLNQSDLTIITRFEDFGTYHVVGHIEYEGRKTQTRELDVLVPKPADLVTKMIWYGGLSMMSGMTVIGIIFLIKLIKSGKLKKKEEPSAPLPISEKQ